jgi:ElaA protein
MKWHLKKFNQLTIDQLYQIIQLRIDIFVVEQQTMYSDLDDKDRHPESLHLFATKSAKQDQKKPAEHSEQPLYQGPADTPDEICAYLRILPPALFDHGMSAIGRVLVSNSGRGQGLGHRLLKDGVIACGQHWPNASIKISAQSHLQPFYNMHGFTTVGEGYLEDGLPHVAMIRPKELGY